MAEPTDTALVELETALGHRFADRRLLRSALVHTSFVNERPRVATESNERLEFLGDAVLGLIAAHRLYSLRPEAHEGDLTVMRAGLVRQSTLARWALSLPLAPNLLLGRGELRGGGRDRPTLLARALEAVIGALYLDGGLIAAEAFLQPLLDRDLADNSSPEQVVDAKSRLQQISQARYDSTPSYAVVEHTGPGHAPVFTIEVTVGPDVVARGSAGSKRSAEQLAAEAALRLLASPEDAGQGVPAEGG